MEIVEAHRSSWAPINLGPYLRGEVVEARPNVLTREDGEYILYPGLVTWISGESESLKSWLAQVAVAEQLKAGGAALYLDFESDPLPIAQRFLALGVDAETIRQQLTYVRPEAPPGEDWAGFRALLAERRWAISVIDGVNAAMSMSGYSPLDIKDAYAWAQGMRVVQQSTDGPMAAVDHVVKNQENRGRYAYGSVAKLNMVDGAHLGVELVKPFGRGLTGKARIRIHKDRPGWLRCIAQGDVLAVLTLTSTADGSVVASLGADLAEGTFRPTVLMERVSTYLQQVGAPVSGTVIRGSVKGNASAIALAISVLTTEGFLSAESGSRGPLYRSIRPFLAAADGIVNLTERSGNVPERSEERVVPVPTYRGRNGERSRPFSQGVLDGLSEQQP